MSEATQSQARSGIPPSQVRRAVWVCPECGSDQVQGLAWCRVNETSEHDDVYGSHTLARVESWDENDGFYCPDCEEAGRDGHISRLSEEVRSC
jgi:predicted RNA-binding Zn-ribbon protein involved in translation (DUF1610 family)